MGRAGNSVELYAYTLEYGRGGGKVQSKAADVLSQRKKTEHCLEYRSATARQRAVRNS